MSGLAITRHGASRMAQRGIRKRDLDLLMTYGSEISADRIMLRNRDAALAIEEHKKRIAAIERLKGKVIVVADGGLVTTYHQANRKRPSRRTRRYGSA